MAEEKIAKEKSYHQEIMDGAYDKWQKDALSGPIPMKVWFESLSEIEKDAVALGKFNQQVTNGGFIQWTQNGYVKVQFERLQQALMRLSQEEVVEKVRALLIEFEEIAERKEWGEGEYTETEYETCEDCDGSGYIQDEDGEDISCYNCDNGETEYEKEYYYSDELNDELSDANLDDKYYELDEEFLKVCEEYFKKCSTTLGFVQDYTPKKMEPVKIKRPKVKLTGIDGNVFVIIGRVMNTLKKANWTEVERREVMDEMKKGDYNHVLQVAMKVCEVY